DKVGSFIDNWQASGALDVDVGIGVDLKDHTRQPIIDVSVVTSDSTLNLTDYEVVLDAIDGTVTYSSSKGLQATDLQASLFDFPVVANIATTDAMTVQEVITIV